jgi:hypothetical protein
MTDLTTSLPWGPFECAPAAAATAATLLAGPPAALHHQLLVEQESEATLVAARQVLAAFLPATAGPDSAGPDSAGPHSAGPDSAGPDSAGPDSAGPDSAAPENAAHEHAALDADQVLAELAEARAAIAEVAGRLRTAPAETAALVLRQRAPLALIEGCWLDTVSQPATQPAVIVNRLGSEQLALLGRGVARHTLAHRRRRLLEEHGVVLPDLLATDFLTAAGARPLTVVTAAFYLALSRLPASFLPEVVGVHCAFRALGTDAALFGDPPDPGHLPRLLAEYLELTARSPTGGTDRARLFAAIRLVTRLELDHVAMLGDLAGWHQGLSLDARMALVVARHGQHAGRQHHRVRISGVPLQDLLADAEADAAAFVRRLRASGQLRPLRGGGCRLTRAIRFGGSMFGIFDDAEARTIEQWAAAVAAGEEPGADLVACTAGDEHATAWARMLAVADPGDVHAVEPPALDERQFLFRLVNVERFPSVLAAAQARARLVLAQAEGLFELGATGQYTDASWFDYSPAALRERVERIYWAKLVDPFQPLAEIPSRTEVINNQKRFALGSLIDGAWAHRIGNTGRFERPGSATLFAIYADEMGRGDVAKNHITLIHQVLASMDVHLPHLRAEEFLTQTELPDATYLFATYQLALALFPDSFYEEILGYNLGIEMFGLGELRLHEMQKMRHHHLDTSYEETHLSIDNVSAGHARQSVDLIVSHLDQAGAAGPGAAGQAWRRVWRGYASFALFIEPALVRRVMAGRAAA